MEKIRQYLHAVVLTVAISMLCGCYRQTTVILSPGDTFPQAITQPQDVLPVETTIPAQETTSSTDATRPTESDSKENSKPGKKPQSEKPKETTAPAECTDPPKDTAPIVATAPVETTAHAEPTATAETTAPVETTMPVETTAPAETTAPKTEPLPHPVYDISSDSISTYERAILEELNRYRSDAALASFHINKKLSALAAIRAYECSMEFSHTRPDGRSWDTVLSDYGASAYTENILYASSGTTAALLIDACMGSDSHSQKILNAAYSTVGIGSYDTGRYVYIVVIFS